ncbi:hypothetical protein NDI85_09920 [Halomicroarcula sp. S1AR25-4]|uniref:hypothetical protein n=1 Tax=Haloarcula sp. S1AR25-4 TaxID=2950538 RepID=UPI002876A161|nr:hypothetical protein [Halomicroarcula sp. S1AR25-4]MDS0278110.1 hypothetical protein [Halomicroarcula sp. S1AR25-4]
MDADDAVLRHVLHLTLDGYLTISQRHEYLLLARVGVRRRHLAGVDDGVAVGHSRVVCGVIESDGWGV